MIENHREAITAPTINPASNQIMNGSSIRNELSPVLFSTNLTLRFNFDESESRVSAASHRHVQRLQVGRLIRLGDFVEHFQFQPFARENLAFSATPRGWVLDFVVDAHVLVDFEFLNRHFQRLLDVQDHPIGKHQPDHQTTDQPKNRFTQCRYIFEVFPKSSFFNRSSSASQAVHEWISRLKVTAAMVKVSQDE